MMVARFHRSIGKEATEEYAVIIDTFHPLHLTEEARRLDDPNYPLTGFIKLSRINAGMITGRLNSGFGIIFFEK